MEREKLTDEERQRLALFDYIPSEEIAKALRIIDAQAAAVQALDEQVAQLTAELAELKVCLDISRGCRKAAEAENARLTEALAAALRLLATRVEATRLDEANAEVARLTEALAAAEQALAEKLSASYWNGKAAQAVSEANTRAEAAELARDAANALLERCNGEICTDDHVGRALAADVRAHLSGQPAQAPTSTLGHPGADEVFARLRQSRQPAAPAPTAAEVELTALYPGRRL